MFKKLTIKMLNLFLANFFEIETPKTTKKGLPAKVKWACGVLFVVMFGLCLLLAEGKPAHGNLSQQTANSAHKVLGLKLFL